MSMIGKTLAHYEITSQIGKGGMGEVYQAKDRKLGRDVAIKVLPEEFARDTDRVARFQREAKLLASLNHPNIAAIHGLEESAGIQFLVLELVEGETLADRIKAGPIPVEESLKLALQIAEALEAAHEKGVIHRDLKPANIKVTPDAKVKVLDFGLAKAFVGDREEVNLSNSPTLSNAATQQGVILGTAAYMSPEQARGKAVDKRADIWAFGSVLFEMLTRRAAFSGRDVTEILAAVIRAEPEWTSLPANLHWRLREVIEHCLKKEAKDRYHDISDVKSDIQRVLADPNGVLMQPIAGAEPRARLLTILPWVAVTAILSIIIAGVAVWNLRKPEPRQVMRFYHDLSEGQQFSELGYPALAVSPDGKQLVYSTSKGLCMRSIAELTAKLIAGTEGDTQQPFFSPDGKWIGYFSAADFKLKKVSVSGGAPVTLCDVAQLLGACWNKDDAIVYGQAGDIMRISASGGTPESIVKAEGRYFTFPQVLPDGKSVLFTLAPQPCKVMVQSLKSGERKELFAATFAQYLPTGHIVYTLPNNNSLFAVPFNVNRLEVTGGPVSVVDGVWETEGSLTGPQCAVSDSGILVYIPGTDVRPASTPRTLVWVNRNGKELQIAAAPKNYLYPNISPDGKRLALSVFSPKSDIWTLDLVRETMTRLTFNEASNIPLWTNDGKRIVFNVGNTAKSAVYWKAADGTGEDERLSSEQNMTYFFPSSWSRDGKTLLLNEASVSRGQFGIDALSLEGDRKFRTLLKEKYPVTQPKISPDGRWMAYVSNESGQVEVYVRPFPEVNNGKWQVSNGGGYSPLWSPDGREMFYRNGDSVTAVAIQTEPTFKAGKTETLFRGTYEGMGDIIDWMWDISPDGKRFLMMKEVVATSKPAAEVPRKINIVVNWLDELKQRVPVK